MRNDLSEGPLSDTGHSRAARESHAGDGAEGPGKAPPSATPSPDASIRGSRARPVRAGPSVSTAPRPPELTPVTDSHLLNTLFSLGQKQLFVATNRKPCAPRVA